MIFPSGRQVCRSAVPSSSVEHQEAIVSGSARRSDSTVYIRSPRRWSGSYDRSHEAHVRKAYAPGDERRTGTSQQNHDPVRSRAGAPQRVTADILRCQTVKELHECLERNQSHASGIAIAAALTHLAKLVVRRERSSSGGTRDGGGGASLLEAEEALSLAVELLQPKLAGLGARGYANCIWACSKCWALDSRPARDGGGALRLAASASATELADAFLDNNMAALANGALGDPLMHPSPDRLSLGPYRLTSRTQVKIWPTCAMD